MSTQQDIYAACSENRPSMLNKENYVPLSSRLLRRMIPKPGDADREVPVEADDQAIQTILLGLPEDNYDVVDSCETAQEIWFTSTDGESIESYYHRFSKLMNDFKRNKHFPEKIAVISSFLKINLTTRMESTCHHLFHPDQPSSSTYMQQPLPNNNSYNPQPPFNYPVFHPDLPSSSTFIQQPLPNNNYNPQPSFNQNYMQQPMPNLEDITDLTAVMNMALALMGRLLSRNSDIQNARNQNGVIVIPGIAHQNGNGNVVAARAKGNANGNNAEEFDLMAAAVDLDEIKKVNVKCILMANLQQASTSGTQTDKAPVYDSDGSAEVQLHDNSYNDEIFNMFTQEEQYSKPLEPIPKPHEVPQNDSNVIFEVSSVEQGGGTVEQHPVNVKETRVLYYSLYNNLATEVEKVNSVNRKLRETNANLTTERFFEISQEKYDKLERCYQQSVYQEQFLLEKHDPSSVCDSEETLELAHESRLKMKQLNKEIKPANYTKINHLSGVFISQMAKSREELYLSNTFKTANVSKSISIPNEEFSDDTTPSVARKFLNEVKSTIVTLQMRVQNFEIQFLKEEAKFVLDFQSLANEADESLAKHKALELEIERLLRAVISQDIMSIVQNNSIVDTSNLQTELDHTLDLVFQKLENKNMKFEFQIRNYEKENAHLKAVYKNLFDSINVTRTQTKTIIDSLQTKLHDTIYENAKLRAQLFDKVSEQKDSTHGKSENTKFVKQSILEKPPSSSRPKLYDVTPLSKSMAIPKVGEMNALSNQVTSNSVHSSHKSKVVKNDKVIAPGMFRIDPRVDVTTKTRRPQPRRNTKNDRVPSASKSSRIMNKDVEVEDHPRSLLLSKNKKHMSSEWPKEKLASPKPSKTRMCLRWSPTGKNFDFKGKLIASSESNGENACTPTLGNLQSNGFQIPPFSLAGSVRFGNDHVAAILGFGDLQWGNILITRVYFVEGLGHNLFSVGQFCDSDLEVAFRRNTCFIRNLEGVDLLKGNHTTNLYTINLHDMASASPICLMARATSTKSRLWHQRLSHLNFNTINDLDRNDLVTGLPKFKYHKEHLCPSCKQGKSKRASHPPKPVPNSKQRLHLLHMDLCGPIRIASINGKRYVLVIVDDYSRYTWVVFLRSKDEAPKAIKTFLKRITVLLQAPVIINDSEDIRKFGAKGDIRFFIGYSTNSCAYRVYNRRTQKIMETMNVTFDELLAMAFEQSSLKPGLQSMISTMYDDHVGGQPSAASRTVPAAQDPQGLQTTTTSTITADSDTYQFILSSNKYSKHFTEC
ncbi:retrovirus-related pol polyprotein from transposon TNT 1-94 [Tanacetum coccineum]